MRKQRKGLVCIKANYVKFLSEKKDFWRFLLTNFKNMTMEKIQKPWYKKWWAIILFVFLGLIIISLLTDNDNLSNKQNTSAPQKQEEQVEVKNESITPVKEELKKIATIPGVSAVDIYGNLNNIGFSCSGPNVGSNNGLASWECKEETSEYMYLVEILGEGPSEILTVQATALNYSGKSTDIVAKDFLGYIASIPYDNSDQVYAKNWVMENIAQNTNKVINGVRFTITGNERSRVLTIANENSDLD